jgi:hypothetical protein
VGGPLREIAAFTGASVTGLNNNAFQIKRGEEMNKAMGRHDDCDFIKADFMNIPMPDNSYDAVYQVRVGAFQIQAHCLPPLFECTTRDVRAQLLVHYDRTVYQGPVVN